MTKTFPLLTAAGAVALFLTIPLGGATAAGPAPQVRTTHAGLAASADAGLAIGCRAEFSDAYAHHFYQSNRLAAWATVDSRCAGVDTGASNAPAVEISASLTLTYCSGVQAGYCVPIAYGGRTVWYSPDEADPGLLDDICGLVNIYCLGYGDLPGKPIGYSQQDSASGTCETACADAGGVQFTAIVRFTVFTSTGWTLYPSAPNCAAGVPDRPDMQTIECLVTTAQFVEEGTESPPVYVPQPPCLDGGMGHPICV